ncbi:Detected protein of confused Function [Hibiscus syriacus]|uniref:Detected protein of confused Function n=1 Tax=Hibiscus syriacus TaxID=106335 RepID=A0A6A3AX43_HIBSY|nr:Detected protein of confused Function [Hibiscus syriacus]
MAILGRSNGYSKVDKEDPEELIHRRAQFLIYKVMEQAKCRRKPSFIRIRLCRLKVKIGRRLKKLRKSVSVSISAARIGVYKQVMNQLKT